jgi:hypothetical protein
MEDNCSICLETIDHTNIKSLGCNHKFHVNCIDEWLQIRRQCPLCRRYVAREAENYSPNPIYLEILQWIRNNQYLVPVPRNDTTVLLAANREHIDVLQWIRNHEYSV